MRSDRAGSHRSGRRRPLPGPTDRRGVLALVGGASVAGLAGCLRTAADPATPAFLDGITNVAHQGGDLLRQGKTLPAFEHALEVGADVLEMDLWLSADEEIVVIHDATVDRTTDGSGRVDEHTLAELTELDAAYGWSPDGGETYPYRGEGIEIPTLEEVLDAFPGTPLLLEPKHESVPPETLLEFLDAHGRLEDVIVGAFEDGVVGDVREIAPDVPTGLGPREGRRFLTTARANEPRYEPPGEFLFPPYDVVGESIVEKAHRVGLEVIPWTVNDREEMGRLVEAGVDGLITDDPAALTDVVDANA